MNRSCLRCAMHMDTFVEDDRIPDQVRISQGCDGDMDEVR